MQRKVVLSQSDGMACRQHGKKPDHGWPVQVVNPDSLSAAQLRLTPQHWSGPPGEQCYVDKVLLTQNDEMEEIYKVRQVVHIVCPDGGMCWVVLAVKSFCQHLHSLERVGHGMQQSMCLWEGLSACGSCWRGHNRAWGLDHIVELLVLWCRTTSAAAGYRLLLADTCLRQLHWHALCLWP